VSEVAAVQRSLEEYDEVGGRWLSPGEKNIMELKNDTAHRVREEFKKEPYCHAVQHFKSGSEDLIYRTVFPSP
jgi:hypothetical protein